MGPAASNYLTEVFPMIIVAVDVAKDKHDCFITNTDGEVLFDPFVIRNDQNGFENLFEKIRSVTDSLRNVKVGLEATGHYHLNLLGYLLDKGLPTCLINPLQTSLFRKSLSFRKTKTDPVDAKAIARLLMSDRTLQPYSLTSYQNEELKSLTRYRADEEAIKIRNAARHSIGTVFPSKSMELRHTIDHIRFLDDEIDEIESQIFVLLDKDPPKMLDIPGMGPRMAAVIVAEVGDFKRFSSPDKLLAYAGLSPTTYQSGQLTSTYAKMEKRGSRYLRYALFNAAKYVCIWDPTFHAYLAKKRSEGKHYNVAISHAAKKLVRLIYHLETTGETYISKAS